MMTIVRLTVSVVMASLLLPVARAADTGWLQPGVRAWYAGGQSSQSGGSSIDVEAAQMITQIQGNVATVVKHSASGFWSYPETPETYVCQQASSEGSIWISPARLAAMQAAQTVTWMGQSCLVKGKASYSFSSLPFYGLLPVEALFVLSPQRQLVILGHSETGLDFEYFFDVETGLLLSQGWTRDSGGHQTYTYLNLAEINYNFATHQAFAEDRGPHCAFASSYSASRSLGWSSGSQLLSCFLVFGSRYGGRIMTKDKGTYQDSNWTGTRSWDYYQKYDPDAGTTRQASLPNSATWTTVGNHLYGWIPPAHRANSSIQVNNNTVARQGGSSLVTFANSVLPYAFAPYALVFNSDGYATDVAFGSLQYGFYVDTRQGLNRQVSFSGPSYYLNTMKQATPSGGLWSDATDIGGGWKWLSWFGCFRPNDNGWVYHEHHRWMFASGSTQAGIWFWTSDLGWLWSANNVYPSFYRSNDSKWIWYQNGSHHPRWFAVLSTGQWESHE